MVTLISKRNSHSELPQAFERRLNEAARKWDYLALSRLPENKLLNYSWYDRFLDQLLLQLFVTPLVTGA
jgi:hypothetical protein